MAKRFARGRRNPTPLLEKTPAAGGGEEEGTGAGTTRSKQWLPPTSRAPPRFLSAEDHRLQKKAGGGRTSILQQQEEDDDVDAIMSAAEMDEEEEDGGETEEDDDDDDDDDDATSDPRRASSQASQELGDDDAPLPPPPMFASSDFDHQEWEEQDAAAEGELQVSMEEQAITIAHGGGSADEEEMETIREEIGPATLPQKSGVGSKEPEHELQVKDRRGGTGTDFKFALETVAGPVPWEELQGVGVDMHAALSWSGEPVPANVAPPDAHDPPAQEKTSSQAQNGVDGENEMGDVQVTRSDQYMSSPNSVFDAPEAAPLPEGGISSSMIPTKRKRRSSDRAETPLWMEPKKRKKQRLNIFSPPTSIDSAAERRSYLRPSNPDIVLASSMPVRPIERGSPSTKKLPLTQPTLKSWVGPISGNKSLRHPIYNPASPISQIMKPTSEIVGHSAVVDRPLQGYEGEDVVRDTVRRGKQRMPAAVESSSDDEMVASHEKPKIVYKSPRRKKETQENLPRRTEPGNRNSLSSHNVIEVDSSPTRDQGSVRAPFAETRQGRSRSKPGNSETPQPRQSSARMMEASARNAVRPTPNDPAPGLEDCSSGESSENGQDPRLGFVCSQCHQHFGRKDQFLRHKLSHKVPKTVYPCPQCEQSFLKKSLLLSHQKATEHKSANPEQGTKGPFSEAEELKLKKYMNRFCSEHEIDSATFKEMMTASCRRGVKSWTYDFIDKQEFLADYYSVLPYRNRKSMQRYRERNYQNVEVGEWTVEDDDYVVNFVAGRGKRWVEIGQHLGRTQDAVSQRWRNKLCHRTARTDGAWSAEETNALVDAVQRLKEYMKLPADSSSDDKIRWSTVSDRLGHARTAQQCANHWRHINREPATRGRGRPPRHSTSGHPKLSTYVVSDDSADDDAAADPRTTSNVGRRERHSAWTAINGNGAKGRVDQTPGDLFQMTKRHHATAETAKKYVDSSEESDHDPETEKDEGDSEEDERRSLVVEVPKRGRGRPKKNETHNKKRRRKSFTNAAPETESEAGEVDSEEVEESAAVENPNSGRGKPKMNEKKKKKSSTVDVVVAESEAEEADSEEVEERSSVVEVPKRGRGRPKKKRTNNTKKKKKSSAAEVKVAESEAEEPGSEWGKERMVSVEAPEPSLARENKRKLSTTNRAAGETEPEVAKQVEERAVSVAAPEPVQPKKKLFTDHAAEAEFEAEEGEERAISTEAPEPTRPIKNKRGKSPTDGAAEESHLSEDSKRSENSEAESENAVTVISPSQTASAGAGSPKLPRHPFDHKTPGKVLGLSQVFGNTQANTSALRPAPQEIIDSAPTRALSDEEQRPSPAIPMRLRPGGPFSSPDMLLAQALAQDEDESDTESETDSQGSSIDLPLVHATIDEAEGEGDDEQEAHEPVDNEADSETESEGSSIDFRPSQAEIGREGESGDHDGAQATINQDDDNLKEVGDSAETRAKEEEVDNHSQQQADTSEDEEEEEKEESQSTDTSDDDVEMQDSEDDASGGGVVGSWMSSIREAAARTWSRSQRLTNQTPLALATATATTISVSPHEVNNGNGEDETSSSGDTDSD